MINRRFVFVSILVVSGFICGLVASEQYFSSITDFHSFRMLNSAKAQENTGLQIFYPNGGEILSGNVTLLWALASEYFGGSVQYCVYYSPDNGIHWIQLAFYIPITSFKWDTTLYETYGTDFLVKVVATSKEWEDKEDISDNTFIIDNTGKTNLNSGGINGNNNGPYTNLFENLPTQLFGFFLSVFVILGAVFSYFLYQTKFKQGSVVDLLQSNKYEFLQTIRHKVIIGLDNIQAEFITESHTIPSLDAAPVPTSIVEYFPSTIRDELQQDIKGRTVLTLIEIAYLDPSETNPAKLAKSLNIPPSTLSKEIKKLVDLEYVETYISAQVLQDARFRNFKITPKGFTFLSILDNALKITIGRLKGK
ncbi:MAG: hypothetical protein ACFFCZ_11150 [Promethearchaeota archaeon]